MLELVNYKKKEIMKNFILGILTIIILFVAYAMFLPVNEVTPPVVVEIPQQEVVETDSVSNLKPYFMETCNETGDQERYCTCAFEYLDRTMTTKEWIELNNLTEDQMYKELEPALNACLKYYN